MSVPSVAAGPAARRLFRAAYPLAIAGLCLWLLGQRLGGISVADIGALAGTVGPWNWLGAILAAGVSFWAVGRYDGVAHRHFGTGLPARAARRAGVLAIAFSQTLGFGLATGAFARWQLLPGLSPLAALRLTLFVAVSFLIALGALICAAALILRAPPALPVWAAGAGLALAAGLVALAFACPVLRVGRYHLRLPSLPAMAAITGWTFVDTAAAALVLALLLPPEAGIGWFMLFPAYLLALGAALISGTPGGVGPFELTLLAVLPQADPQMIMAGIVAYRAIYFAIPALIAGGVLLRAHFRVAKPCCPGGGQAEDPNMDTAPAEVGLLRQNGGRMLVSHGVQMASFATAQCRVGLFDPIAGALPDTLNTLAKHARQENRLPCLYKCNARSAALARAQGWPVLRIAQEAVLRPDTFDISGRAHRQLRRKLRHVAKAGVRVVRAGPDLPLGRMQGLDAAWQDAHGPARGTTMGRFEPGYLAGQRVYLAWMGDRLVGFITFHTAAQDWCLDLLRPAPDAPDGTVHGLICAALEDARTQALPRLSLAALPDHALARCGRTGLAQFKRSFAPRFEPRYAAAPNRAALALALADIARAVHWPDPLPGPGARALPHDDHEQNGIALRPEA